MLIESGERWRRPDEPPPDRWSDAGFTPLRPWIHVLLLSTLSFVVPGWPGVVLAVAALACALEVAYRHVREHRATPRGSARPSRGRPGALPAPD